ncbi:DUF4157 domain-containing protein, partial [Anabaena sp. UHCC 0399]|uniref:eCIS core domain-containing protein n=1 Tax=Anabaena sp. UHCC 0399 TaxID=3110238 RepID=UPI002B21BE9B
MKQQNLRQTKNVIASSNRESALAQLTVRVASRREGIARNSTHPIEELQSAIGNRAVNQLLTNQPTVQTKPMFRGLSSELRSRSVSERESPSPLQAKPAKQADSTSVSEVQPENKTGLPDRLKAGIENFSGLAMDDVRVHYNSSKPSQLQALAYTQGTDIHVAPGQETHLPHEAWHIVQQKQGRVKPTIQMKGIQINDDKGLEHEADMMGAKALQGEQVQVVGAASTWFLHLGQRGQPTSHTAKGRTIQCKGSKTDLERLKQLTDETNYLVKYLKMMCLEINCLQRDLFSISELREDIDKFVTKGIGIHNSALWNPPITSRKVIVSKDKKSIKEALIAQTQTLYEDIYTFWKSYRYLLNMVTEVRNLKEALFDETGTLAHNSEIEQKIIEFKASDKQRTTLEDLEQDVATLNRLYGILASSITKLISKLMNYPAIHEKIKQRAKRQTQTGSGIAAEGGKAEQGDYEGDYEYVPNLYKRSPLKDEYIGYVNPNLLGSK